MSELFGYFLGGFGIAIIAMSFIVYHDDKGLPRWKDSKEHLSEKELLFVSTAVLFWPVAIISISFGGIAFIISWFGHKTSGYLRNLFTAKKKQLP